MTCKVGRYRLAGPKQVTSNHRPARVAELEAGKRLHMRHSGDPGARGVLVYQLRLSSKPLQMPCWAVTAARVMPITLQTSSEGDVYAARPKSRIAWRHQREDRQWFHDQGKKPLTRSSSFWKEVRWDKLWWKSEARVCLGPALRANDNWHSASRYSALICGLDVQGSNSLTK